MTAAAPPETGGPLPRHRHPFPSARSSDWTAYRVFIEKLQGPADPSLDLSRAECAIEKKAKRTREKEMEHEAINRQEKSVERLLKQREKGSNEKEKK